MCWRSNSPAGGPPPASLPRPSPSSSSCCRSPPPRPVSFCTVPETRSSALRRTASNGPSTTCPARSAGLRRRWVKPMIETANLRRTIPLVDLGAQNSSLGPDIREAIAGVLGRGDFILGDEVRLFEREFAEYCRVSHAVGVGSGSDALQLACRALELGEGDEVIVPAMTFAATAFAVSL